MRANSTLLSGILSCCLPTWLESSRLLLNRIRFAAAERFASARLFSRWFDDLLGGKHVVVVVLMLIVEHGRNWIITAYIARSLAVGDVEWKRS
jgi:hypothetical protein